MPIYMIDYLYSCCFHLLMLLTIIFIQYTWSIIALNNKKVIGFAVIEHEGTWILFDTEYTL